MSEAIPNSPADQSLPPAYIAQSPICINAAGKSVGKGLFAGRDLEPGDVIASVKKPLVAALDPDRLKDTCANCFLWTAGEDVGSRLYVPEGTKVNMCGGCKRVKYCSRKCQKEAWHNGHKLECMIWKVLEGREIPKAVLAAMQVLIRRRHGIISDNSWEMLCRLESHVDDFKRTDQYGAIELMAMGTGQFSGTSDMFSRDFIAGMYARILTNCLTLITPTLDPLGIIVDPLLCHINHSCDPNAYVMTDGSEVTVRPLRSIAKDEEVFISYIDTTYPYTRRQSELKSRWFFTCKCSKCEKGSALSEDMWSITPNDVPLGWKQKADKMIENDDFATDAANYVGPSQDEKRVAALQGRAFEYYKEEQGSIEPVKIIEEGMNLCADSKLWPLHRQPYATLRDDLILSLLSSGDYQRAWTHAAKRYHRILPTIYPERIHPVRVVQTWQTAMIALYLAQKPPITPGLEMSIIAILLVKEVEDACKLSHGENSAFTKSVKQRYQEMLASSHEDLGPFANKAIETEAPKQRELFEQFAYADDDAKLQALAK